MIKRNFFLILISLALIFPACSCPQKEKTVAQNHLITAVYQSDTGEMLTAVFNTIENTVEVKLPDGRRTKLPVARSGSGARYSDGKESFWEHHGEGTFRIGEKIIFQGKSEN